MRAAIHALRSAGRTGLADQIAEHGRASLVDYSTRLNDHRPSAALEPALGEALDRELARLGWSEIRRAEAIDDFSTRRVLQTATHLTASEGPTFLAVHAVALAGLPASAVYLVGAYSGVAFSNPAWSGCLSYSTRHGLGALVAPGTRIFSALVKDQANRERDGLGFDRRISLLPARLRDGLVYGAPVPDRMRRVVQSLTPALAGLAPEAGESFGPWAVSFCQAVVRLVLGRESIGYFDLNAWLADYLARVLSDPAHPMARLLFDRDLRGKLTAALDETPTWFYTGVRQGKRTRVSPLAVAGDALCGPGFEIAWTPAAVVGALEAGRLCPALLPCFTALAVLNRVRCLGSFEQVEYLPRIVRALAEAGFEPARDLDPASTAWLTTGRALAADGRPVYPLDVVLGTPFDPDSRTQLWDWISPLMPRLLGRRGNPA